MIESAIKEYDYIQKRLEENEQEIRERDDNIKAKKEEFQIEKEATAQIVHSTKQNVASIVEILDNDDFKFDPLKHSAPVSLEEYMEENFYNKVRVPS